MTAAKANEIKLVRIYDAPVEAVWAAWTDPEQVAQWWGPRGFTLTTHSKDLRPGGSWIYTMHGPDGTDYPNSMHYFEVEKHAKLVYDHGANDDRPPLFRVTVLFVPLKNKTRLEMTSTLPTPEAAREMRKFIKQAGGESTWDRLAEHLERRSSGTEKFVITRSFDAPLATVFRMWAEPEHLLRWLPPTGATMKFIRSDIRPGGSSFYEMTGTGFKLHGRTEYLEIEKPHRLVYTQEFCDENEKPSRHPLAPDFPSKMLTIVTLAEEGPNRTRVTVTWEMHGSVTREELETFVNFRTSMTQGWTGSFDKLEAVLEGVS